MSHRKFEAPRHGSKGFLPKKRSKRHRGKWMEGFCNFYDEFVSSDPELAIAEPTGDLVTLPFQAVWIWKFDLSYFKSLTDWFIIVYSQVSPRPSLRMMQASLSTWPASWATRWQSVSACSLASQPFLPFFLYDEPQIQLWALCWENLSLNWTNIYNLIYSEPIVTVTKVNISRPVWLISSVRWTDPAPRTTRRKLWRASPSSRPLPWSPLEW